MASYLPENLQLTTIKPSVPFQLCYYHSCANRGISPPTTSRAEFSYPYRHERDQQDQCNLNRHATNVTGVHAHEPAQTVCSPAHTPAELDRRYSSGLCASDSLCPHAALPTCIPHITTQNRTTNRVYSSRLSLLKVVGLSSSLPQPHSCVLTGQTTTTQPQNLHCNKTWRA